MITDRLREEVGRPMASSTLMPGLDALEHVALAPRGGGRPPEGLERGVAGARGPRHRVGHLELIHLSGWRRKMSSPAPASRSSNLGPGARRGVLEVGRDDPGAGPARLRAGAADRHRGRLAGGQDPGRCGRRSLPDHRPADMPSLVSFPFAIILFADHDPGDPVRDRDGRAPSVANAGRSPAWTHPAAAGQGGQDDGLRRLRCSVTCTCPRRCPRSSPGLSRRGHSRSTPWSPAS